MSRFTHGFFLFKERIAEEMARLCCASVLSVLLFGTPLIFGLPTGSVNNQPGAANTARQNSNVGEADSDGVIIRSEKTRTGTLSDFIIDRMVEQCSGCIDPAVAFYGCIENTTQLPAVWAAMGLNATLMRLRTINTFLLRGGNLTNDEHTVVTVIQDMPDDSQNMTITDMFNMFGAQSDNLCQSADGLLACLNPYLSVCFPDSDSSNSLQLDQSLQTTGNVQTTGLAPVNGNTATNTTDSPAGDNVVPPMDADDYDNTFFLIPYLETQSQIFPLVQQTLMSLCAGQATPLKGLIDSVPCLMRSVNQAYSSCSMCQIIPSMVSGSNATTINLPMDPLCSAMRDCAECQLDMASQTCGQDVANLIQTVVQQYFDTVQCFPSTNSNSIRQPFNVAVL